MPVVAVGVAAIAIGVAVEVGTTFAIIAAVGATVGAIGAVTGNKALQIAGGVIGAIGGIGALATSAGIFGSMGGAALSEVAAGTTAAESMSPFGAASGIDAEIAQWSTYSGAVDAGFAGAPTMSNAIPAGFDAQGNDVINLSGEVTAPAGDSGLSGVTANAASPNVIPEAATDTGVPNTQMAGQEMVDAQGNIAQGGDPTGIDPPTTPAAPNVPNANTNSILNRGVGVDPKGNPLAVTNASAPATGANPPVQPGLPTESVSIANTEGGAGPFEPINNPDPAGGNSSGGSGVWAGIKDFLKNNDRLAAGVLQAGSSFVAGATSSLTPAQVAALQAQAAANQAAANLSQRQLSNMQSGVPTAYRTPVTGSTGLINTPPRVPVSGAPA